MNVSNIGVDLLNSFDIHDLLEKNINSVNDIMSLENSIAARGVNMPKDFTSVPSSPNIMIRNFAGTTSQSRYIEAAKTSLQVEQQMTLRSHQVLAAATEEVLAANGIDRTNCGTAAGTAMEMRRVSNKKIWKESPKNLDEIQTSIERNAEKATAPKDENGKPVEGGAESTNSDASMPENSVSTFDESAAPFQNVDGAVPQVPAPAQAVRSINIVV